MNLDASLVAVVVCALAAVAGFAWAVMERRRADRLQGDYWSLRDQSANAEAELRTLKAQSEAQAEILRNQAAQSANVVAEALLKRTEETFRNREQLAQARLEAQLKPVAETLAKFQEQVTAVEKTR
ncbi:MAG: DNA recombination protein RmuC, partial [Brevundimonas sp.]